MIQVAQIEGKDWRQELHKFLTAHRSTPQMTTGVAPFFLMFGREMRSKLPELRREAPITNEEIRDRDWARKLTQKDYMDTKRHAVWSFPHTLKGQRSSVRFRGVQSLPCGKRERTPTNSPSVSPSKWGGRTSKLHFVESDPGSPN